MFNNILTEIKRLFTFYTDWQRVLTNLLTKQREFFSSQSIIHSFHFGSNAMHKPNRVTKKARGDNLEIPDGIFHSKKNREGGDYDNPDSYILKAKKFAEPLFQ